MKHYVKSRRRKTPRYFTRYEMSNTDDSDCDRFILSHFDDLLTEIFSYLDCGRYGRVIGSIKIGKDIKFLFYVDRDCKKEEIVEYDLLGTSE